MSNSILTITCSIDLSDAINPAYLIGLGEALKSIGAMAGGSSFEDSDEEGQEPPEDDQNCSDPQEEDWDGTGTECTGEVVVSEVEPEPEPEPAPEPEPEPAPEPEKPDRMEAIRRAAKKVGVRSTPHRSAEDGRAARIEAGLPKKAADLTRTEEWLAGYMASEKARDVKVHEECVLGRDYLLDGRLCQVARLLSNGVAVVNSRGTRYYRAVPASRLDGLYLCPARPEHAGDVKAGSTAYVGYGEKGADKASSYRKARVSGISGDRATVVFEDTGTDVTCPVSSLAPADLVEKVKFRK